MCKNVQIDYHLYKTNGTWFLCTRTNLTLNKSPCTLTPNVSIALLFFFFFFCLALIVVATGRPGKRNDVCGTPKTHLTIFRQVRSCNTLVLYLPRKLKPQLQRHRLHRHRTETSSSRQNIRPKVYSVRYSVPSVYNMIYRYIHEYNIIWVLFTSFNITQYIIILYNCVQYSTRLMLKLLKYYMRTITVYYIKYIIRPTQLQVCKNRHQNAVKGVLYSILIESDTNNIIII